MISNILITGTSSGIGYSAVKYLNNKGFKVFATVRKKEDAIMLNKEISSNIFPVILDVTDINSIRTAFQLIEKEVGDFGLQGLVNNAGMCIGQPVEFMSIELFKEELDINLLGVIRMTQIFLPLIRKGKGRIINISSSNGFISFPFMGGYCASKYAIEALSDSLRYELDEWKIPVCVINPDKIISPIWDKTFNNSLKHFNNLPELAIDLYKNQLSKVEVAMNKLEKKAYNPEIICHSIEHALISRNPKYNYMPEFSTKLQYFLIRFLSKKTLFFLIKRMMFK